MILRRNKQSKFLKAIQHAGQWTCRKYQDGRGWIGTAWSECFLCDGVWSHTIHWTVPVEIEYNEKMYPTL